MNEYLIGNIILAVFIGYVLVSLFGTRGLVKYHKMNKIMLESVSNEPKRTLGLKGCRVNVINITVSLLLMITITGVHFFLREIFVLIACIGFYAFLQYTCNAKLRYIVKQIDELPRN